ncbi:MAG: tRNA pseudouridine(38-40) synthase TruA [Syntrophothermus sp.]
MSTRYFIFFSFKGTRYHGWQLQPNGITVQQVLNDALSTLLNEKIASVGAGRTDSGVHARLFCAHFDSSNENLVSDHNLIFRLNRYLPDDISVLSVNKVIPDASSRYNAISRTYKYYISTIKDPFSDELNWFLYGKLNVDDMNKASEILMKYSDFTSFSRLHSGSKTNICNIYSASWEEFPGKLVFTITADRFLRNMVRSVVGTMVALGSGKLSLEEFAEIIDAKDRCRAGMSAPGKGLFLENIEYPDGIFI